jgi:hypothetical protein
VATADLSHRPNSNNSGTLTAFILGQSENYDSEIGSADDRFESLVAAAAENRGVRFTRKAAGAIANRRGS